MLVSTALLHSNASATAACFWLIHRDSIGSEGRAQSNPFLPSKPCPVRSSFWTSKQLFVLHISLWAEGSCLLEGMQVLRHQLMQQHWDPGCYLESLGDLPFAETVIVDPSPHRHMLEHMDGPETRWVLLECCTVSALMYLSFYLSDNLSPGPQLH